MVANTNPQQRKKGESERVNGDRDQIKLLILDLKDSNLLDSGNQEGLEGN